MYSLIKSSLASVALLIPVFCYSQTTWTGSSDAIFWDTAGNWSAGVPNSSVGAVFNSATGATGLSNDFTIASLTFNAGVAASDTITTLGLASLTVNGAIINNTSNIQILDLVVNAGGSASWAGPIEYKNNVNVGANSLTLTGSHTFSGENLNFTLTNLSTYGRFLGGFTSSFSGNIIISGAYTGNAGDSFDFTTGNFNGVSINNVSLPTLSGGLVWNSSNFLTDGILSVSAIPEPSTYAVVFGLGALGFCAVRRRRKA